jgi:hypothetical protein
MSDERRFSARLSGQYDKLKLAYPDFDTLQTRVAEAVSRLRPGADDADAARALVIGAGSGFTSRAVLDAVPELSLFFIHPGTVSCAEMRLVTARFFQRKSV